MSIYNCSLILNWKYGKYRDEDIKSYSNCFNAWEIIIYLPNLFKSKLFLSPRNNHLNNLKDYEDFEKRTKSMLLVIAKMISFNLKILQVRVNCNNNKKTHRAISSSWPYWDTSHQ